MNTTSVTQSPTIPKYRNDKRCTVSFDKILQRPLDLSYIPSNLSLRTIREGGEFGSEEERIDEYTIEETSKWNISKYCWSQLQREQLLATLRKP